jgi:medium-chain acyl-[acyl-carrier-protein] hydrolase
MKRMQATLKGWFYKPNPATNKRVRLFCLPYAGGNSCSIYQRWAELMAPDVDLVLVNLPGRAHRLREALHESMDALVADLYEAFRSELDRPFALFGHSMGALICFELTRMLRRGGDPMPLHLFASGSPAPCRRRSRRLSGLTQQELIGELRHINGTPRELLANREVMKLLLPVVRADFSVVDSYQYVEEPPLPCSITAFAGGSDACVKEQDIAVWRYETAANFRMRVVPGEHMFLNDQRPAMIEEINGSLSCLPAAGLHFSRL